jgi:electron transfer flavoprotein beta subunit
VALKIVVCVKQVPNPEIASSVFQVNEATKDVVPIPGMPLVMSPFDEQAVEAALRIRDECGDATITVLTLGPESARETLKHGLSMGAHEGIFLSGAGIEKAGSHAVALALAAAIRKAGPFDLVITGRQAADWDAGVVGCGIAELLNVPVVTYAKSVSVAAGVAVIERVLDDGFETVETLLPCIVTVSNELGEPRKPSLRETMRAARKPVTAWICEDLGLGSQCAESDRQALPHQTRERLFVPTKQSACELFTGGSPREIAKSLVGRLLESKIL